MTNRYSLLILIRITIDDMLSDGLESVCSSQQHPTSRQSAIWLGSVPPGFIGWLRSTYTVNVYRELQVFYREIRLQGSHIYRDLSCVILLVIVRVILYKIHRDCM